MVELANERGARIIGPNCLGLISPGVAKMGGIGGPAKDAAKAYKPGPVGVMSRSGGMTTEISSSLTQAGLGVSTAISIGGDAIIGSTYAELMPLFEEDPQTEAIVIYTEPGGRMEAARPSAATRRCSRRSASTSPSRARIYEPSEFERNVKAIQRRRPPRRHPGQGPRLHRQHRPRDRRWRRLSPTLTDAAASQGGSPANYAESAATRRSPSLCGLAKEVLGKDGVEKIAVMMSIVSNTRVDIVARGVIKACLELGKDPAETIVVFRIPGAWEDEGAKILDKYGIEYCDRSVSMWEAAGRAVAKVQGERCRWQSFSTKTSPSSSRGSPAARPST